MLGNFHPSKIEDEIYSIMDDYLLGADLYEKGLIDAVIDYLANYTKVDYQLCCSPWNDEAGGVCAVSFVEDGFPHLVMFDYRS